MSKFEDLTGKNFSHLSVIKRGNNIGVKTAWVCKCDCGNVITVLGANLKTGASTQCSVCGHKQAAKKAIKDITGKRFGRLTVIRKQDTQRSNRTLWLCRCDCGNEVSVTENNLQQGITKSCGCLKDEKTRERSTTHGMSRSRIYSIWSGIKDRCLNKNNVAYKFYGGRGVYICDRWKNSFSNFYNDMYDGYSDDLTIDRIDNNRGYEPGNCRWATIQEQQKNRRNKVEITIDGKTARAYEWESVSPVKKSTILDRIRRGYSPYDAVFSPSFLSKEGAV